MKYVEVIIPIALPGTFTYSVPDDLGIQEVLPGQRVVVSFGKSKFFTGIILQVSDALEGHFDPKPVIDVLDKKPIFKVIQFDFLLWLADYYMCSLGDAFNAFLPGGFKFSNESYLALNPDIEVDQLILSEEEEWLMARLQKGEMVLGDVKKLTHHPQPIKLVKSLAERGVIDLFEKLKDKYSPKKERRVRLTENYLEKKQLEVLLNQLESKPKQQDVLLSYINELSLLEDTSQNEKGISRAIFLKTGLSQSSLKTLIKNGIFEEWEANVDRFDFQETSDSFIPELSELQDLKKSEILSGFDDKKVVLLKGVTGSGKTEIYISIIQETLEAGGKVLYLLPEIALTTQIISRFRKVFGNTFGVFHSRLSDNERVEIWKKVLDGSFRFVIGVRSAVFLPFDDIELIIVDEEHESSFKQHDPAPRYHARDAAIFLGHLHKANVLLGTATPSLESYTNALQGKYHLVELGERFQQIPHPEIIFANLAIERHQKTIKGSFSSLLLQEISNSLEANKQVILFQNHRGYSPYIECQDCGNIPKCPNCSVSLTYHIYQNQLICHYCGFKEYLSSTCPNCNSMDQKTIGAGTEKIEEELQTLIPEAKIQRMDLDTTRNKYAYQQIIDDFTDGNTDILIGTQMVSKGLDFGNVNLVGVLNADQIIHFPDFRAHERAFQLLTQVSGRAGRKEPGKVVIQTSDPEQEILKDVSFQDFERFYQREILEREKFRYSPFFRIIRITVRHKHKEVSLEASEQLQFLVAKELGNRVSLPIEPLINKIRNLYRYELLMRIERKGINLGQVKSFLQSSADTLLALPSFKSVRVHFDVDPV